MRKGKSNLFCRNGVTIIGLLILNSACSSAPKGFCDCMEKGNAVNIKSNEILEGNITEQTKKELLLLRKEQKKACEPFYNNAGPQMREWKKECEKK